MITTVTLNTSVDKLYVMENVRLGQVMRVSHVSATPGGKGLNVARVAAQQGAQVRALGFAAGFNGAYIAKKLQELGIPEDFVWYEGESRICINIRDKSTGVHTELLEPGMSVPEEKTGEFLKKYSEALKTSDVITISGSMPVGVPKDFYGRLIDLANSAKVPVILDASGDAFAAAVHCRPSIIKPNQDELSAYFKTRIETEEDLISAAEKFHELGIDTVVVSLGADGVFVSQMDAVYRARPPRIDTVNTVGCGDSMVASLAIGVEKRWTMEETIRFAVAVSAASAMDERAGFSDPVLTANLLPQVELRKLK